MEPSILNSIKKMIGPDINYGEYDIDLIIHINSTLSVLTSLGIGPEEGFIITDDSSIWTDLICDSKKLEMVKSYVYMKTKLVFDPPQSSAVIASFEKLIAEFEWRAKVAAETTHSKT